MPFADAPVRETQICRQPSVRGYSVKRADLWGSLSLSADAEAAAAAAAAAALAVGVRAKRLRCSLPAAAAAGPAHSQAMPVPLQPAGPLPLQWCHMQRL